jgi:hypothetical protein
MRFFFIIFLNVRIFFWVLYIYMTKYNVGFDFDGVIHRNVTLPDNIGQRHPSIPFHHIPTDKFDRIIDLIKMYKQHNYNCYIVTARKSKSKGVIRKTLDDFGIFNTIIPDNNIITTGDTGGCKNAYLEYYNIHDFYDDSVNIFRSIIVAKKQNKLQNLKNCYITYPESKRIKKIII